MVELLARKLWRRQEIPHTATGNVDTIVAELNLNLGPWVYDTKNGFLRRMNEINGAIEYTIAQNYNRHYEVPTIDSRIVFTKQAEHDLVHRRFGHAFAQNPNCTACRTTRTWKRQGQHGQEK